jgi:hypothetical protein
MGINILENLNGVVQANGIDEQIRLKVPDLLMVEKPVGIKEVLQFGSVLVENAHVIIQTE